jgi:dolichol-phosphate mannosyltransferase
MDSVSILVPVLNEAESLRELIREIRAVENNNGTVYDIVFVDDGSTDRTWESIQHFALSDCRIHAIRLRKNLGKSIALQAGVSVCRSKYIVTLDGDLQDDPQEIPNLMKKLLEGFDLVSGWKSSRQDSLSKRWSSKAFNFTISMLSGVHLHDHNCGLKAYRRTVFRNIQLSDGLHRFIPVLAARQGFRITEIPVHHRPRRHGVSRYGWGRALEACRDLWGIYVFNKGISKSPVEFDSELIAEKINCNFS